jgi:3'(2'), 5'-bisphosphate nucleotidase
LHRHAGTSEIVLEAALEAVAAAARICRAVQARLSEFQTITKDDKSPVTIADFASQAVVAHMLRERLGPGITLAAEESAAGLRGPERAAVRGAIVEAARLEWPGVTDDALLDAIDAGTGDPRSPAAREYGFWTLDPIDGTKGFLRGEQYAVALALIERGTPRLGVLGCPNLDPDPSLAFDRPSPCGTLLLARAGDGCQEITGLDARGPRRRARALAWREGETLTLARSVEAAHSNKGATDAVMQGAGIQIRSLYLDSQCKYAVVARGQAHAYLRLPVKPGYIERIWDHAAGALVAKEAGAIVSDAAGAALDFSHGRGLEANRGVCVAPAGVHARVIAAVQREFQGRGRD